MYPKKKICQKNKKKLLKKRHWLGRSQKFLYPYPKISQFLCPPPPKKKVLKKKQWWGGSQKNLYPNPKISQSFFQKKQQKFVKKESLAGRITNNLYPYQL